MLLPEVAIPAVENTRSTGADEAGIAKISWAITDSKGYLSLTVLRFHISLDQKALPVSADQMRFRSFRKNPVALQPQFLKYYKSRQREDWQLTWRTAWTSTVKLRWCLSSSSEHGEQAKPKTKTSCDSLMSYVTMLGVVTRIVVVVIKLWVI